MFLSLFNFSVTISKKVKGMFTPINEVVYFQVFLFDFSI